ncbi:AP-3 complex subunit delta [Coemansia javaensis]|uniref:AP-3 complex subunit delta n=1 Tax=Coemansia javaensis TaxID=2761396 RepID=A0A9W8H7E8_9FUNG|nr:AP-3 complex subunit delta [Coemansia javaensis]
MFEKTLSDLIQGLRANKRNEAEYIQRSLEEIQREVQQSDMRCKSAAVDKLNYLHMLGYDMNWASFNVVEVMASPRFGEKRTGYLAAAQSFNQETDVLMLVTNLIRKDLAAPSAMEVGLALDGLAQTATAELAADLFDDVLAVLGHPRACVRKKAVVCLYRLVQRHPEGLPALVPQLKERLDDPDPSVVSAAVGVVCELARTDPRSYLPLAPKLYHLLTTLTNNWILIKIVNLFAALAPIEPRLARKLHGPLSRLVTTTSAMSLLYECIHTAVVGDVIGVPLPVPDAIGRETDFAELCAQKLEVFYQSRDHNLRYVGLVTLARLQARRPDLVAGQYATVLACLDDPDLSIRMRAIEVVAAMTTRKTLVGTVNHIVAQLARSSTVALHPAGPAALMAAGSAPAAAEGDLPQTDAHGTSLVSAQGAIAAPKRDCADPADSPEYRLAAVEAIAGMCSRESYGNMVDFEWYVATLADLVYVAGVDVDRLLSERLLDVTVRVRQVRRFSVAVARRLLADARLAGRAAADGANAATLATAAYILGEYCPLLPAEPDDATLLLLPPGLASLSDDQQAVFVQAAAKAYTNWLRDVAGDWSADAWEAVRSVTASIQRTLAQIFFPDGAAGTSGDAVARLAAGLPLQAGCRLRQLAEIIKTVSVATSNLGDAAPPVCAELHALFTMYELNPVSAAAQGKVPVPEGLDLDAPIGDPIPDTSHKVLPPPPPPPPPAAAAQLHQRGSRHDRGSGDRAAHRARENDPFYLGGAAHGAARELPDVDDIPVMALDLGDKPRSSGGGGGGSKKAKKAKKKHRRDRPRTPSPPPPAVDIAGDEDVPEAPPA